MKIFKYKNQIDQFNILESVFIAKDLTEAIKIAENLNKRYSWGNQANDEITPIEMKEVIILTSVITD